MELFEHVNQQYPELIPLAERMRPKNLDEVIGQEHILGQGKVLRLAIESDQLPSMILWGQPGSGKTTIAKVIAKHTGSQFLSYSAVSSGLKEMREVLEKAKDLYQFQRRRTVLFIDEIHRFNRAQQDAFLPYVEQGIVILIGATTENPSFEVNAALLSRCTVFMVNSLTENNLIQILNHALENPEQGLGQWGLKAEEAALTHMARIANGDARAALNALELAGSLARKEGQKLITLKLAETALLKRPLRYDQAGEEHYNLISALHKSIRGSDPDAALYWLGRMLESGEEPHFLLRRMARMASEDIGLADPQALILAASALQVFDLVGLPEGVLFLAELAIYLSLAPKSNSLEVGYQKTQETIKATGNLDVPLHIRNAPTRQMKEWGYGKDYRYAHDYSGHWVPDDYLPKEILKERFFNPGDLGWEGKMKARIEEHFQKRDDLRKQKNQRPDLPS